MLAREVMTAPVVTVNPNIAVKEAIRLLDRHDITSLPVVDEEQRLVGIVSQADLLRGEVHWDPRGDVRAAREWREPRAATVADVMTRRVITVDENADASDIARLMLDTGVKSIPVADGDTVVGVVSRRDLIRALARTDDQIQEEIGSLLTEAGLADWTASVDDGNVRLVGHGSERDRRIAEILTRTVAGVGEVSVSGSPGARR
jgi:CBS domain-containing protein